MGEFVNQTPAGPVLNPQYQSSCTINPSQYPQYASSNWEDHFWANQEGAEQALPVMYRGNPYWKLRPAKGMRDFMIICDNHLKEIVVSEFELNPPTDREYDLFFKRIIESQRFVVRDYLGRQHLFTRGGYNVKRSSPDKRAEIIRVNREEAARLSNLKNKPTRRRVV